PDRPRERVRRAAGRADRAPRRRRGRAAAFRARPCERDHAARRGRARRTAPTGRRGLRAERSHPDRLRVAERRDGGDGRPVRDDAWRDPRGPRPRYGHGLMIERVEQLRTQAEAEIAAASTSQALEELRVRYLGRKAELPQILRGVAEL